MDRLTAAMGLGLGLLAAAGWWPLRREAARPLEVAGETLLLPIPVRQAAPAIDEILEYVPPAPRAPARAVAEPLPAPPTPVTASESIREAAIAQSPTAEDPSAAALETGAPPPRAAPDADRLRRLLSVYERINRAP